MYLLVYLTNILALRRLQFKTTHNLELIIVSLAMKCIYHKERRLSMEAVKPEDEL